jgi:hypothetical protein
MATKGSLLAHLCLQFATHPENLAVEALGYLLKESEDTRSSFVGLLRARGIDLPDSLRFSTQVTGKDATRPDLVGKDRVGREVVLIEAKFWAVRGQIGRSVPSVPAVRGSGPCWDTELRCAQAPSPKLGSVHT